MRRTWGGEYENVAILVVIAVNEDGYREVLGGVKLIVGDKRLGMPEAIGEAFPDIKY